MMARHNFLAHLSEPRENLPDKLLWWREMVNQVQGSSKWKRRKSNQQRARATNRREKLRPMTARPARKKARLRSAAFEDDK